MHINKFWDENMTSLLEFIFVTWHKLLTLSEDQYQSKVERLNELNFLLSKKDDQPQIGLDQPQPEHVPSAGKRFLTRPKPISVPVGAMAVASSFGKPSPGNLFPARKRKNLFPPAVLASLKALRQSREMTLTPILCCVMIKPLGLNFRIGKKERSRGGQMPSSTS